MKQKRILGKFFILCAITVAALLIGPDGAFSTPINLGSNYASEYQGPFYGNWYTQYQFALTGEPFNETTGAWDLSNPALAFCIDGTMGSKGPYSLDSLSGYINNGAPNRKPNYTIDKLNLAAKYADYFFTYGGYQSAYQVAIWIELGIKNPIQNALGDAAQVIRGQELWGTYNLSNSLAVVYSANGQNYLRQSVSEPATMLLLGAGLMGLAVAGRKRFIK